MGGVTSRRRDRVTQENKSNKKQHIFQSSSSNTSHPKDTDHECESGMEDMLISENEKNELVSLVTDKNISMDFILEMKEAFLYFDTVIA